VLAARRHISLVGLLADADWRSIKARLQRRDRRGRFAEMGGGFMFDFALPFGRFIRVTGKVVGQSGTDDVDVEIRGYEGIQDGIYSVPSKSGEVVKAVINLDRGGGDSAPSPAAKPQAPDTPQLHPQLTPTDDIEEAKATGRPLRQLQRGTFPEPVQAAYDELKEFYRNEAEKRVAVSEPDEPGALGKAIGDTSADLKVASAEIKSRLSAAIKKEYGDIGFDEEEVRYIEEAIDADIQDFAHDMIVKKHTDPKKFEENYGVENKTKFSEKILKDANIAVAIPYAVLEKIIDDGRLKSQFESKTSGGFLAPEVRTKTELSHFGYHPNVDPSKRPIFGYLTSGGKIDAETAEEVTYYGEIHLVMKKDVQSRTTYTAQDSLESPSIQPKLFGQVSPDTVSYAGGHHGYAEAQIHGGVSLQDVDYAAIFVDNELVDGSVTDSEFLFAKKKLEKAGIKVVPIRSKQSLNTTTGEVSDLESSGDNTPASNTPQLHPQLTPTDDIEEAKATGRPLRQLQRGTFPEPVQAAYDRVLKELVERYEVYDGVKQEATANPIRDLQEAIKSEYAKVGFTDSEVSDISQAIQNDLQERHMRAEMKWRMGKEAYDAQYSDEIRLQTAKDALKDARISVAVSTDVLDKIIADGRLKSQFESQTSGGLVAEWARLRVEAIQFGYHPTVEPTKRPIYGYLTSGGKIDEDSLMRISQYGQLQLVLKKDVEARATYTSEDSISFSSLEPAPFGVPSAATSVSPDNFYSLYAEAQIHGGVSLQDVDYATVFVRPADEIDSGQNGVSEEEYEKISAALSRAGIRVVPIRDAEALDVNTGEVKNRYADEVSSAEPAEPTPQLHPQLTPTDDIEEAKATGRPLRQLQRGTFPEPVQAAYDELKGLFTQMSELPQGEEMPPGYTEAPRARLQKAVFEEYEKIGFTYEEAMTIHAAITEDVDNYREFMHLKKTSTPEYYDKKYGDEARKARSAEVLRDARIAVAVPYELVDKVIGDGRLKSQFETRTSRGALHPTARTKVDISQLGYHPTVEPTKRPIYGYLTSGGKMNEQSVGGVAQYGAVQLVMKKDVHGRSTYTGEDSLGSPNLQPKLFGEASPEATMYGFGYGEAQIHGGVSLQDVDYVAVQVTREPIEFSHDPVVSEEQFAEIKEKFEKIGVRVIRFDRGQEVDLATGEVTGDRKVEESPV